jgi:type IV pilus assembly protein PilC
MLLLSLTVTSFLVAWVLPRFAKIYESREAALPGPTRFLLGMTEVIAASWVELVVGGATVVAMLLYARTTQLGRRVVDTLKLKTPVIGHTFTLLYLTRASRTLATLLTAGVPILDAVRISRGVTRNVLWERLWDRCENAMTAGQPISSAILTSRLIPASVAQMIGAGERTGRLPEVLDRIGERTEEELDAAVRQTTQLLEPAMILFMGGAIGGVAIALLLPIFTITNVLSGG